MPDQEEYQQQLRILHAYRQTLAHELEQAAKYGGISFAPPAVSNGIEDARQEVAKIKQVIRAWGYSVDDNPMDGDLAVPTTTALPQIYPEIQPVQSESVPKVSNNVKPDKPTISVVTNRQALFSVICAAIVTIALANTIDIAFWVDWIIFSALYFLIATIVNAMASEK